jgi:hypothetical protein
MENAEIYWHTYRWDYTEIIYKDVAKLYYLDNTKPILTYNNMTKYWDYIIVKSKLYKLNKEKVILLKDNILDYNFKEKWYIEILHNWEWTYKLYKIDNKLTKIDHWYNCYNVEIINDYIVYSLNNYYHIFKEKEVFKDLIIEWTHDLGKYIWLKVKWRWQIYKNEKLMIEWENRPHRIWRRIELDNQLYDKDFNKVILE